jgi:hypothetical protein
MILSENEDLQKAKLIIDTGFIGIVEDGRLYGASGQAAGRS